MCYTDYVPRRNLTLTIDEDVLLAARKVALDRKTSVNQLVRDYLAQIACEKDPREGAWAELEELFRTTPIDIGPITWTREDLYER
jgi:hypothetical protein